MNHLTLVKKAGIRDKNKYILDSLIYLIATLFPLVSGRLISLIFSKLEANNVKGIFLIVVMLFIVLIGRILFVYIYSITNAISRFTTDTTLWGNFVKKLLKSPSSNALSVNKGEALNVLKEDVYQIDNYISNYTTKFISTVIFAVIASFILIRIDAKIFGVALILIGGIFYISRWFEKKCYQTRIQSRERATESALLISNAFKNANQIRIQGCEKYLVAELKRVNICRSQAVFKDALVRQSALSIQQYATECGVGVILLLFILFNNNSIGDITLFVYYMSFVSGTVRAFGDILLEKKYVMVAENNISRIAHNICYNELCNVNKEVSNWNSNSNLGKFNCLELQGLTFPFQEADNYVFKNISFKVKRGQRLVISGKTGSGKTLLLESMLGFQKHPKGEVLINNKCVKTNEIMKLGIVGYCPQNPHFFNLSMKENLNIAQDQEDFINVLESLDLYKCYLEHLKDETIGSDARMLSGGQRQRLSLARVLLQQPQVLILDDILRTLDANTKNKIWDYLKQDKQYTIIVVSNDEKILKEADNIIVLESGHVCFEGNYRRLLESDVDLDFIEREYIDEC